MMHQVVEPASILHEILHRDLMHFDVAPAQARALRVQGGCYRVSIKCERGVLYETLTYHDNLYFASAKWLIHTIVGSAFYYFWHFRLLYIH